MNKEKKDRIAQISITGHTTLLSAIKKMDAESMKLLLVMKDGSFNGLVSIGDIQRAIINNTSLESEVSQIMRRNINVCRSGEPFEAIKDKMIAFRTEFMPVLDSSNTIADIYFWDEICGGLSPSHSSLSIPVVIMAGGLGSRLRPITNIIPKPLMPMGDKPILQIIIDSFVNYDIHDFYVSVNYKHEMIRYYFESIEDKQYTINFFVEDSPLGTAGSLFLIKDRIESAFFVTNCDILIDQDYSEVYHYHCENENDITIVGALKHYQIPYGIIETSECGKLERLQEKPELTFMINSGFYILEREMLDMIPENAFYHMTDLIEAARKAGKKIGVFPVSEKTLLDIGEWNELQVSLKEFEKRIRT